MPDIPDKPDLDALLSADSFVRRSSLSAEQWQMLEAYLGVKLPPDYRTLALRYDLGTLEYNGMRFAPSPPYAPREILRAFQAQLDRRNFPFTRLFEARQVILVGSYQDEAVLVLAVDTNATPAGATTYPYGSLWSYDPLDLDSERRATNVFDFVSSSFTQAVHMMSYAQHVVADESEPLSPEQSDALFASLVAIDPAIAGYAFWREWIGMLG